MLDNDSEYLRYFGLNYNPFPVAPDSINFYLSDHIEQILTELVHGIMVKKGFMILTGEIGLGKTTINRRIMNILDDKGVEVSLILLSLFQEAELLREINRDFGIETENLELSAQIKILNDFLLEKYNEGKNCTIIIDDAQNLTYESLELIRMISNLETDHEKLVQILLIGQPELDEKLKDPRLRQLNSRIVIREKALPLTNEKLRNYILFKLSLAGNTGKTLITNGAIRKIHSLSNGNFRAVNILMDRCLYVAFLFNHGKIRISTVKEAYKDLGWSYGKKKNLIYLIIALILLLSLVWGYKKGGFDVLKKMGSKTRSEKNLPQKIEPLNRESSKDEVTKFLSGYKLAHLSKPLFEAIGSGHYNDISDIIFEQSGDRLIILNTLPEHIKGEYHILHLAFQEKREEQFLLIWKPTIEIKEFYLGYRGEEIGQLERLLASVHLYDGNFDNTVGRRVMRSLNRYQKSRGIKQAVFPDTETLFRLANE